MLSEFLKGPQQVGGRPGKTIEMVLIVSLARQPRRNISFPVLRLFGLRRGNAALKTTAHRFLQIRWCAILHSAQPSQTSTVKVQSES
jgi:hypothetical protein